GCEGAARDLHFPEKPLYCLLDSEAEQIVASFRIGPVCKADELRIVIEHLLEMGHQPCSVGGITGQAAAHMVVDTAGEHPFEADQDGIAMFTVAGVEPGEPKGGHEGGVRKFRGTPQSAGFSVDHARYAIRQA